METAFAVMARHPVQGAGEAKPVLRHGPAPIHLPVKNDKARPEVIAQQVKDWQAEGFGNMALITKTEKAAKALHKALADLIPEARLVLSGDISFEGGVQVMDASLVKGLEFDCVLIADAEDPTYPDERFYAKLFYVLCTRPLHRLAFAYAGECTKHLPSCQNSHPAV
jgi:DNA helicase-2/ATP-dependent DNA helicase PcrA